MNIISALFSYLGLGVIIGAFPNTISNGQAVDATPVMADFNWIQSQVNANAAAASDLATTNANVTANTTNISNIGKRSTFTPVLQFGGATTGITYNANGQIGYYTNIGNFIFVCGAVYISNKGSAVGVATITGLPTSGNLTWPSLTNTGYLLQIGLTGVTIPGTSGGTIPIATLPVNSGTMNLLAINSGVGFSAYNNADFSNGAGVIFQGLYPNA